jgi:hypothetical protein
LIPVQALQFGGRFPGGITADDLKENDPVPAIDPIAASRKNCRVEITQRWILIIGTCVADSNIDHRQSARLIPKRSNLQRGGDRL